jgi:hypothetical protein
VKRTIDTTKLSQKAEEASLRIDVERQFGIPDLARLLRSAYYHGYRDALLEHRFPDTSLSPQEPK